MDGRCKGQQTLQSHYAANRLTEQWTGGWARRKKSDRQADSYTMTLTEDEDRQTDRWDDKQESRQVKEMFSESDNQSRHTGDMDVYHWTKGQPDIQTGTKGRANL